ncbi:MAG: NrtA/SsuA/CpmA family ABC transporter substrate-binding protein [bacterium]|nr:NrtA/SsuA/CpmA family ABC transporter substrate-binding protein [bacterium]MDP3963772.1 NrtA/SsuA/CpmA family ABC transporter substrate-binding protein [bacterium]
MAIKAGKFIFGIFIVVVAIAIGYVFLSSHKRSADVQPYSGPVEKISIGTVADSSALVLLAQDRGYFADNGLKADLVSYGLGMSGLNDLAGGKLDAVVASDFAGVRSIFRGDRVKIIASIAKANAYEIVARKDHGIEVPGDLKGKKIGITKGSAGEFWLGIFLTYNELLARDVIVVDLAVGELTPAILSGQIDAVLNLEPYMYNAKQGLGDNAVSWRGQSGQGAYSLLYVAGDLAKNRVAVIDRLIRTLIQAESFMNANQRDALNFIARHFEHDDAYMQSVVMPKYTFGVSLEQALLLVMEDEARWMIERKLTNASTVPNYLDFMYLESLAGAKPDAVTVIR